jgi:magnesium transporter
MITVHSEPIRALSIVRERGRRHSNHLLDRGVGMLLFTLIDTMVDNYVRVADIYEDRLDNLEEESFADNVPAELLETASDMRRDILDVRRLAASQREILLPFTRGVYECLPAALETQFVHVVDHLTKVIELADSLRDLMASVRDNYHASLARQTNAVVKTLTIFASVLLPLSLIAGIYGMNLHNWPSEQDPLGFTGVLIVMATIATSLLSFFRYKKWL